MLNKKQEIYFEVLLHDIRSVQNVASIFRLCEVLGSAKIILFGITPGPKDRFGRIREDFKKISLGSEESVLWERLEEEVFEGGKSEAFSVLKKYISDFQKNNGVVVALEQSSNSVDYKKVEIDKNKKYLIIPGREVEGVQKEILELVDVVSEIPQYGTKESLNIFSAMSVCLYRFFDK